MTKAASMPSIAGGLFHTDLCGRAGERAKRLRGSLAR
jgi:hypothetical protein